MMPLSSLSSLNPFNAHVPEQSVRNVVMPSNFSENSDLVHFYPPDLAEMHYTLFFFKEYQMGTTPGL